LQQVSGYRVTDIKNDIKDTIKDDIKDTIKYNEPGAYVRRS